MEKNIKIMLVSLLIGINIQQSKAFEKSQPLLSGMFRNALQYGSSVAPYSQYTVPRHFRSVQPYLLSGVKRPLSSEEGKKKIENIINDMKFKGLLAPQDNVLKLVSMGEFAWNGRGDNPKTRQYDASELIPKDIYINMVSHAQEILKKESPGIAFCLGTAAIETGKTLDGKIIGENRCTIITSGEQSEVLEATKKEVSTVDNWDKRVSVKSGEGSKIFMIKDILGDGRPAALLVSICLDYMDAVKAQAITFPAAADFILSPSAGWPGADSLMDCKVIVNDSAINKFYELPVSSGSDHVEKPNYTGVWKTEIQDGAFTKIFKTLGIESTGMACKTFLEALPFNSTRLAEYTQAKKYMDLTYNTVENLNPDFEIIIPHRFDISPEVTLDRIRTIMLDAEKGEPILLTQGITLDTLKKNYEEIKIRIQEAPLSYLSREVDKCIRKNIQEELSKNSKFFESDQPLEELYKNKEFYESLQKIVQKSIYKQLIGIFEADTTYYEEIRKIMGLAFLEQIIKKLGQELFYEPMLQKDTQGESYIQNAIAESLYSEYDHYLHQNIEIAIERVDSLEKERKEIDHLIEEKKSSLDEAKKEYERDPLKEATKERKERLERELTNHMKAHDKLLEKKQRLKENHEKMERQNNQKEQERRKLEEKRIKDSLERKREHIFRK